MIFLMEKVMVRKERPLDQGKKASGILRKFISFLEKEPLTLEKEDDIYHLLDTKTLVRVVRKFAACCL